MVACLPADEKAVKKNYVQRFLDRFELVKEESEGWAVPCPCPGHGVDGRDSDPSLWVTVLPDGKIYLYCRVGCTYGGVLKALGMTHEDLACPPGEEPAEATSYGGRLSHPVGEDYLDLLDRVYRDLLAGLTLEAAHRTTMIDRGLTGEEVDLREYRTLLLSRVHELLGGLYDKYKDTLYQIPGFVWRDGHPHFVPEFTGIVVPVRDSKGRVVALKVRTAGKPKYLYVTSGKCSRSPGAPVHFPCTRETPSLSRVRLTEGEIKADIATALSGTFTIGIPGVASYWKAQGAIAGLGVQETLISFDWSDILSKGGVREAALKLARELAARGYHVGVEKWEGAKGIDEALVAHIKPQEVWGITEVERLFSGLPPLGDGPAATPGVSEPEEGEVIEATNDPHALARSFLAKTQVAPGWPRFRVCDSLWWEYDGKAYVQVSEEQVKAMLVPSMKEDFDAQNKQAVSSWMKAHPTKDKALAPKAVQVFIPVVNSTLMVLKSMVGVPRGLKQPCWLDGAGPFPAEDVVVLNNGILHVPSYLKGAEAFIAHTPNLFAAQRLSYDFLPGGPEPTEWLKFLHSLWPHEQESIDTLQEVMGYLLTRDTRQQQIFFLLGPRRAGKGTIARVIKAMVGDSNFTGPTLQSLGSQFGLEPLIDKSVAVVSDARLSGKADFQLIIERLLSLSGEDTVTADRKHRTGQDIRFSPRFMILTNILPELKDRSSALVGRLLVLQLTVSFQGREDKHLEDRLLKELPSIFLWALEGLKRLRERGKFVQPKSGRPALRDMECLDNPAKVFVEECCDFDPEGSVMMEDLYKAWVAWNKEQGEDYPAEKAGLGKLIRQAYPQIPAAKQKKENGVHKGRYYEGIRLKAAPDADPAPEAGPVT
jgi:P4 family phage/plasmid primase-like protien